MERNLIYILVVDILTVLFCWLVVSLLSPSVIKSIREEDALGLGGIVLFAFLLLGANTLYSTMNDILIAFFGKNNLTPQEKKL